MHKLLDLARRVEEAEGPSRELDAEIFRAIGAPVPQEFAGKVIALTFDEARSAFFAEFPNEHLIIRYEPPAYSSSLDAAMTLVPEKWRIYSADFSVEGLFGWTLKGPFAPDDDDEMFVVFEWGNAATPALALTAASLRARAALEQADDA